MRRCFVSNDSGRPLVKSDQVYVCVCVFVCIHEAEQGANAGVGTK